MIFGVTREHKGNCVGRGEHFSSRGQSVTSTGFYSPLFSCRQRQERNTSGHFREQWAFPNPLSQQITSVCHSQGPAPPCLMRAVVLSLHHAEQKGKAKKCGCCPRCVWFCSSLCCGASSASLLFPLKYTYPKTYDSRETSFTAVHGCFGVHVDTPRLPKGQIPSAYVHEATSASSRLMLAGIPVAVSPSLLSLHEEFQLQDTVGSRFTCGHWTLIPGCWC